MEKDKKTPDDTANYYGSIIYASNEENALLAEAFDEYRDNE